MGEDGNDDVSKHPSTGTHNEVSQITGGKVVQARTISGGVHEVAQHAQASEHAELYQAGRDQYITGGDVHMHASPQPVDEWAEDLAQGVQKLWQREEDHRKVPYPAPLPVRWHPATGELRDHWANIRLLPAGVSAEPLALAGRIEQLAEIYRRVPSGRLVLLGPAGAGKTVLASRLALDLLAARQPGQRVPVIVSVGSWNPETTSLHNWLAEQLARDHPGLAVPVGKGGPTRARALIEAGRILPILDGFDEIDTGRHSAALRQLNSPSNGPMVITSRVDEYATAVHGADVLKAAAVVELDELTLDDLTAYLPRTTAGGHRTGIWDPILQRLRDEPQDPGSATLRRVLTNPLMVFLARTLYSDTPGHDPTELLDTHRFPTAPALHDHLLAEFVPAVYQTGQPDSTQRRWTVDRAQRYLTYLAHHLHRAGTPDLAWWQLRDTIPRWHRTLLFALVDGLVAGLVAGLAFGLTDMLESGLTAALASGLTVALTVGLTRGLRDQRLRGKPRFLSHKFTIGLAVGLTVGFVVGLVVGLAGGLTLGLTDGLAYGLTAALMAGLIGLRSTGPQPTRTRLQIHDRVRFIAGRFAFWFVVGFVGGLAVGLAYGLTAAVRDGLAARLVGGLVVGLTVGLTAGLAAAVVFGLEAPVNAADVVSAAESLAWDRRNAIRKMIAAGLTGGLVDGLVGGLVGGLGAAVRGALVVGLTVGYVTVRPTSAWIYWLILVRGWLPLTGRLPWRVQAFLTDAYQRGVLRQTGAVYQFRHARLQDHLTTETPAAVPAADR